MRKLGVDFSKRSAIEDKKVENIFEDVCEKGSICMVGRPLGSYVGNRTLL